MFDVKMVSKKIRDARIRRNMTQSNLADELGVSYKIRILKCPELCDKIN